MFYSNWQGFYTVRQASFATTLSVHKHSTFESMYAMRMCSRRAISSFKSNCNVEFVVDSIRCKRVPTAYSAVTRLARARRRYMQPLLLMHYNKYAGRRFGGIETVDLTLRGVDIRDKSKRVPFFLYSFYRQSEQQQPVFRIDSQLIKFSRKFFVLYASYVFVYKRIQDVLPRARRYRYAAKEQKNSIRRSIQDLYTFKR